MMKSIRDIAWDVSEEVYRADPAISYSQLSTFAREGQRVIPYLHDKKDAEALRFGGLVDCLMTEPDTLDSRFFIADFSKVSDKIQTICKKIYNVTKGLEGDLSKISHDILIRVITEEEYYSNWREETRVKDIITKGAEFYKLLSLTGDKILMSSDDFKSAQYCVERLKTTMFTAPIFFENPFTSDNIEKVYQLKFKSSRIGVRPVRCMYDFMIVDHNNKTIRPIDLKTTGKDEEDFEDSFIQWEYFLQGTLYTQILKDVIEQDEYFKSFTILPYEFIVINRYTVAPIIWIFKDNFYTGNFIDTKTNMILKGWKELLVELDWHITNRIYDYSYTTYIQNGYKTITRIIPYESDKKR